MTSKTVGVMTLTSVIAYHYFCCSGGTPVNSDLRTRQQWSQNVTVIAGGSITLPCNQTSDATDRFVEWRQHKDVYGGLTVRDVYKNVSIQPAFAGRFSVQQLPRGSCSLVIDSVQPGDSAVYKCLCGMKCEYNLLVLYSELNTAASVQQATSVAAIVDRHSSVTEKVLYIVLIVFALAALVVWRTKYWHRCRRNCRRRAKCMEITVTKRIHRESVGSAINDSLQNSPLISPHQPTQHHEVQLSMMRNDTLAQWTDVFGIAELNGNVYAAMRESDVILAFPVHAPDDVPWHIRVSGLREPRDIVACAETNQLFVADGTTSGYVKQITFGCGTEGNASYKSFSLPTCEFRRDESCRCSLPVGCHVRRFRFAEPRRAMYLRPLSLSMRNRRLLTICNDYLLLYEINMNYNEDAEEVACISVLGMNPEHAIETVSETFIVSCNTRPRPKLIEMNLRGVELRDFTVTVGYIARYLLGCSTIFGCSDTAFLVADEFGHRVVHLDWSTKVQTVLFDETNDELRSPWRMCRAERSRQLIVAGRLSKNFHYFDIGTCDLCQPNASGDNGGIAS